MTVCWMRRLAAGLKEKSLRATLHGLVTLELAGALDAATAEMPVS
ncbi:hypothetical protein [Streptomyces candidus]|uniref:Uncharacterized protein n=1 Tax=Streptomyces candidus TaxID=67283 RepID=A0A7X0LPI5_9ACTN|nr:hypothetical protein [Streptomyces candidus]MBB6436002.1 hypothetical protein [Streptomyces candidus]GHH43300.1 hypothetical protein GCM10018773_29060 [Streptomyces candidus]